MNFTRLSSTLFSTVILLLCNPCYSEDLINFKTKAFKIRGVSSQANSKSNFTIEMSFASPFQITHFELRDPPRIVVDYSPLVIPKPLMISVDDNNWINGIRIGRHPDKTRFVIDLIEQYPPVIYSLVQNDKVVLIALSNSPSQQKQAELVEEVKTERKLTEKTAPLKIDKKIEMEIPAPTLVQTPKNNAPKLVEAKKVTQGLDTYSGVQQRRVTLFEPDREDSPKLKTESPELAPTENIVQPQAITIAEDTLSNFTDLKIAVDQVLIKFYAGKPPVNNLVVKNLTGERLFISTYVTHVTDPSVAQSQRIISNNLLVSPRKFSIEPHNQKTVRLVAKQTRISSEKIYYVSFLPDKRHFKDSHIKFDVEGRKGDITVVSGIETQVLLMPQSFQTNLIWERNKDTLELFNDSNSSILLTQGKSCLPDSNCIPLNNKRIYIGQKWKIRVPAASAVSFVKEIGNQFENLLIPAK